MLGYIFGVFLLISALLFIVQPHSLRIIMSHSQKALLSLSITKLPQRCRLRFKEKDTNDFKKLPFPKGHTIFINELLNVQVIKPLKNGVLKLVFQENQVTSSGRDV